MLTLITGGELYAPEPRGRHDVLLAHDAIASIGELDRRAIEAAGLEVNVIDARGCIVTPGIIDPHEHLIGGSGERGFASQTPEITLRELVSGGITTVVGCLGVDTTTRTMPALVAKAKALNEEGLTGYVYTGGYNVPPSTLTGSVRNDLLFVHEVIGAGEIAISDRRSTEPSVPELARLVRDAYVGGMLAGKAGVTHFHVGDGAGRLAPIRALLDDYAIDPDLLYPTHVERNGALMQEAIELTHRGVTVDVDVVEQDLAVWVRFFLERGGDPTRLTVSSDAAITSPATLLDQIRSCVLEHGCSIEQTLPFVTSNTARVLKLQNKGCLEVGADADVLVLRRESLELVTVIGGGTLFMSDGQLQRSETYLAESNRRISLYGKKALPEE
jgi:beta-aspartyl-dipeptidase (metallo-type)